MTNTVFIDGNLVRDPETRHTQSGTAICSLTIANNNKYTTKAGEQKEDTAFVDITVFGKSAEICSEQLGKGDPVLVGGLLKQDQWQDKQTGAKRSKLYVKAHSVQRLVRANKPASGDAEQAHDAQQGHYEYDAGNYEGEDTGSMPF